ncbi:Retrovirus-related Pol polyprotein from transposon 17.6, partial [Mucuna pruriens]
MSAQLVSKPNQVGQSDPKPINDISSSLPPPKELKPLPSHLKYAYLDTEQQLPIIIANNLHQVLTRCIDTNPVLNFEKCHFMVTEGIVLGHLVSNRGIEIDIITSLPNLASMQEESLEIIFALDKFRSYLLGSKIIVFSNHAALTFLLKKLDAKPRLIRWMLLLQEFNKEIKDKKGVENSVAYHLSRIERETDSIPI